MSSVNKVKNNKGQITVFVALVFTVLFTVFGMTISMGMFIHDKINLQNATDLASYYVASKQAEMLSAIAHSNYQIRQSWKLAAFRYRVLANGSRTDSFRHPGITTNPANFASDHSNVYAPASEFVNSSGNIVPPRVCIGATHMFKEFSGDNLCKEINFSVDYVPTVRVRIGQGFVGSVNDTIQDTNDTIRDRCASTAYANWWFANTIVGAHKFEQRDRRVVINALAENLALPIVEGGMKDLDGEDVYEGAFKTFVYNLSESNRENLEAAQIRFTNSMEGLSPSQWLSPILVNAVLPFSLFDPRGGLCTEGLRTHVDYTEILDLLSLPESSFAREWSANLDPDGVIEYFGSISNHSADEFLNISVGVEKNPWYMVYNMAEATASSRPLFMMNILGEQINIAATSYAKPFGGRIGPWFLSQWSQSSNNSDSGSRIDPLLPERILDPTALGDLSPTEALEQNTLRPNYSRFPSDEAGLTTNASMVAYGKIVGPWGIESPTDVETSLYHYVNATYSYSNGLYNDPLAQNISGTTDGPWDSFIRRLEIAAVAPDAFDMYYYSIMPGFYDYFVRDKLDDWLPISNSDVQLRGDIGSYGGEGATDELRSFDVVDQMTINSLVEVEDGAEFARPRVAPWLQGGIYALLTSWVSGNTVMNYDTADSAEVISLFASCRDVLEESQPLVPSECRHGGRAGYSVKLVSRKFLESGGLPLGGEGVSGQIRNPPPQQTVASP